MGGLPCLEQLNIWGELFGKNGQVTIGAVWWKRKCIASNYWEINSVLGTFKAK